MVVCYGQYYFIRSPLKRNFVRRRYCFWVVYRGRIDINFLYFLYSVYRVGRDIRNYFHIFIYIFIQFGNIGERNGVKMKFLSYFEKSYLM